jgi:hypothetical protein
MKMRIVGLNKLKSEIKRKTNEIIDKGISEYADKILKESQEEYSKKICHIRMNELRKTFLSEERPDPIEHPYEIDFI